MIATVFICKVQQQSPLLCLWRSSPAINFERNVAKYQPCNCDRLSWRGSCITSFRCWSGQVMRLSWHASWITFSPRCWSCQVMRLFSMALSSNCATLYMQTSATSTVNQACYWPLAACTALTNIKLNFKQIHMSCHTRILRWRRHWNVHCA